MDYRTIVPDTADPIGAVDLASLQALEADLARRVQARGAQVVVDHRSPESIRPPRDDVRPSWEPRDLVGAGCVALALFLAAIAPMILRNDARPAPQTRLLASDRDAAHNPPLAMLVRNPGMVSLGCGGAAACAPR